MTTVITTPAQALSTHAISPQDNKDSSVNSVASVAVAKKTGILKRFLRSSSDDHGRRDGQISVISAPVLIETTNKSVIEYMLTSQSTQKNDMCVRPIFKERFEFFSPVADAQEVHSITPLRTEIKETPAKSRAAEYPLQSDDFQFSEPELCSSGSFSPQHAPKLSGSTLNNDHDLESAGEDQEDHCQQNDQNSHRDHDILALAIFESTADFISHEGAAAWLGDIDENNAHVLQLYMGLFNWNNSSIIGSFRALCKKLYMKAESQQLIRILDAFATRWIACNPAHGFQNHSIVYSIAYSILLLNTDIQKTSRSRYVHDTLGTLCGFLDVSVMTGSPESRARFSRHADYAKSQYMSTTDTNVSTRPCRNLVCDRIVYSVKEWKKLVTEVLKNIYDEIHRDPLKLGIDRSRLEAESTKILPDSRSMSPSDSEAISIGSSADASSLSSRQSSRHHLRTRRSTGSMRTIRVKHGNADSDMDNSSPAKSLFARSPSALFSRSLTDKKSLKTSKLTDYDYQALIANHNQMSISPSHSSNASANYSVGLPEIARNDSFLPKENANTLKEVPRTSSLELLPIKEDRPCNGSPLIKEGQLRFQAVIDNNARGLKKYAKIKQWVEVFVSVQQGLLRVYQMESLKGNQKSSLERRILSDEMPLCHTLSQVGSSSSVRQGRSNVFKTTSSNKIEVESIQWTLLLPDGRLLIFEAESKDQANEYVHCCNYWAARTSREPLVESVSSSEFGWTRPLEIIAEKSEGSGSYAPSLKSGSFDSIYVDSEKIQVKDWKAPVQSLIMSTNDTELQLKSLEGYKEVVEKLLEDHSAYRAALLRIFAPQYLVSSKVHSNWEKRSHYLLTETLKYEIYVSVLKSIA